nr:MAG TPA: hypothetical protein [Caudoviricetes sp.]
MSDKHRKNTRQSTLAVIARWLTGHTKNEGDKLGTARPKS